MRSQKIVYRKTGAGKFVKNVREHYLREDIPCGLSSCVQCKRSPDAVLEFRADGALLVLDPELFLSQIDFLEQVPFTHALVAQSALQQVQDRSRFLYERVRELLGDASRAFYVFANEFHRGTFVDGGGGDRLPRAMRALLLWLSRHLPSTQHLLYLCADEEAARAFQRFYDGYVAHAGDGAPAAPVRTEALARFAARSFPDRPEFADLVVAAPAAAPEGAELFAPHLGREALEQGLREQRFRQGPFRAKAGGRGVVEAGGEPLPVPDARAGNRAIDGDIVCVEPISVDDSKAAIAGKEGEGCKAITPNSEKTQGTKATNATKGEEGQNGWRVVGVLQRRWRSAYPGALQALPGAAARGRRAALFVPSDSALPKVRVVTRRADALLGQRVLCAIDRWDARSRRPEGHLVGVLGAIGDAETETEALLLQHNVQYRPFAEEVLRCLPPAWDVDSPERFPSASASGGRFRRDLRSLDAVCSIDPPGCTDIDDALHARLLPDGGAEVGVHIADVTSFVLPGTPLDAEARRRGSTVYLVDRRIDMLPGRLGTDWCSLHGGQDRWAFSVLWRLDRHGEIVHEEVAKTIIRNRRAMTYAEAQDVINGLDKQRGPSTGQRHAIDDDDDDDDDWEALLRAHAALDASRAVERSLLLLRYFARILRRARFARGALELASAEVRFSRTSEVTAGPFEPQSSTSALPSGDGDGEGGGGGHCETHHVVEEFMLLANSAVAARIVRRFPRTALLRRHPVPDEARFQPLLHAARAMVRKEKRPQLEGFEFRVGSNVELSRSLREMRSLVSDPYFDTLLRLWATRSMSQAVYFASGTLDEREYTHYGLAAPVYTHFTSPIRRYADVIVHRLLACTMDLCAEDVVLGEQRWGARELEKLAVELNRTHKMAQYAARASVALYTQIYFRGRFEQQEAYIVKVRDGTLDIFVPKYGFEKRVHVNPKVEKSPAEVAAAAAAAATDLTAPADVEEEEDAIKELQEFVFNEEKQSLKAKTRLDGHGKPLKFSIFDRVRVEISVDDSNPHRPDIRLLVIRPNLHEPLGSDPTREEKRHKKK